MTPFSTWASLVWLVFQILWGYQWCRCNGLLERSFSGLCKVEYEEVFLFFLLCYKGLMRPASYTTVIVVKEKCQDSVLGSFIMFIMLFLSRAEGRIEDSWRFFELGDFLLYFLPQKFSCFIACYLPPFSFSDGFKNMRNNRKELFTNYSSSFTKYLLFDKCYIPDTEFSFKLEENGLFF